MLLNGLYMPTIVCPLSLPQVCAARGRPARGPLGDDGGFAEAHGEAGAVVEQDHVQEEHLPSSIGSGVPVHSIGQSTPDGGWLMPMV